MFVIVDELNANSTTSWCFCICTDCCDVICILCRSRSKADHVKACCCPGCRKRYSQLLCADSCLSLCLLACLAISVTVVRYILILQTHLNLRLLLVKLLIGCKAATLWNRAIIWICTGVIMCCEHFNWMHFNP